MMQHDSSPCSLTLDVLGIAWPCLYHHGLLTPLKSPMGKWQEWRAACSSVLGHSSLLMFSCNEKYHISNTFLGGKTQPEHLPLFVCWVFFPLFSSICVLLQGTLVERPIYRTSVNHSHCFCACRCVTVQLWACLLSCVNMHVCQYVSWSEYCLGVFIIYYNAWH